jgi:hypothetical protein
MIKNNYKLEVWQDMDIESPREWDNLGTIAVHESCKYSGIADFKADRETLEEIASDKDNIVLSVYLYDHGSISVSTNAFNCPWDSGQIGWIYATKASMRDCFMVKRITKKIKEQTIANLKAEIETLDKYLSGQVYGYTLNKVKHCDCCGLDSYEARESCGGFYGLEDIAGEIGYYGFNLTDVERAYYE